MALILFIDDDLGSRMLYEKASTILGHKPILADTGKLGLALAKDRQPNLIILDLNLADTNGFFVLSQLQLEPATARIPVVILSAGVSKTDDQLIRSSGAVAYLDKPISLDKLQKIIDQYAVVTKNE